MPDQLTTTKTTGPAKAPAKKKEADDPNAAVADAVEALREAMLERGDDPGAVEAQLHAVIPAEQNVVGNYADLQRMGAILVEDDSSGLAEAVPAPAPDPEV